MKNIFNDVFNDIVRKKGLTYRDYLYIIYGALLRLLYCARNPVTVDHNRN